MTQNKTNLLATDVISEARLSTPNLENNQDKLRELKAELITLERALECSGFATTCYILEEYDDSDDSYCMDPYEYQYNQNEITRIKNEIERICR